MSEQTDSKSDRGRMTRGAFPRMPLKYVEELANVIQDVGHGERARLVTVLDRVNRKPTSSTTKTLLTSAGRGYGLVIGSASDTHLSLTDRGTALVNALTDYDRRVAQFEALHHNELFRAFIEKFKHRPMPTNEVAIDFIKDSFNLSEKDADVAVGVIKKNLDDYGLAEVVGDRKVVDPPEDVLATLQLSTVLDASPNGPAASEPQEQQLHTPSTPRNIPASEAANGIIPQIAFNIQIQLPSDASPETYEAIFRNIATHLLRRTSE